MIAYSYLRFSSAAQADGHSIERQTAAALAWCEGNGIPLDTETTFRDAGKSAFTGDHKRNPDRHALALFLRMVEDGRVGKGSYLLIENLDRLSREEEVPACHLLTGILLSGITVVQLSPTEFRLTAQSSGFDIMRAVMELSRGHNESLIKSRRVRAAWQAKKKLARSEGRPMSRGQMPSWIDLHHGKFIVLDDKAAIVEMIFRLSLSGLGEGAIAHRLIKDKTPPLFGKRWTRGNVRFLLNDRRVLGEHQPMDRTRRQRKHEGEPITDYYPAVIDPATWHLVRDGRNKRRLHPGAWGMYVNVFSGLLQDAVQGGTYQATTQKHRSGRNVRVLFNPGVREGQTRSLSFPFKVFENEFLEWLQNDLTPSDLRLESGGEGKLAALSAERANLDGRLDKITDELEKGGEVGPLAAAARKIEERLRELNRVIADATRESAIAPAEDLQLVQGLVKSIRDSEDEHEARVQMRAALRRVVDCIMMFVVVPQGTKDRICVAQVFFRNIQYRRTFFIFYRPGARGREAPKPFVWSDSEPEAKELKQIDLRDTAQANALAQSLRQGHWSPFESPPQGKWRGRKRKP